MSESHALPVADRPRRGIAVPRPLRVALMAALFMAFFLGSPVIALVLFPLLRLAAGPSSKRRATYFLHRGMAFIAGTARTLGIVDLDLPPPPVDLTKPYVMISNHPTYIDMIVILGVFDRLTCVTNGRWWKHWALGRLLRATEYLPGPGSGLPESDSMLDMMVAHIRSGHPLLIFPRANVHFAISCVVSGGARSKRPPARTSPSFRCSSRSIGRT